MVDIPGPTRSKRKGAHAPAHPVSSEHHSEWEFNDLAALAARICDARWALLTLQDPAGQCNPLVLAWAGPADQDLGPIVALTLEVAKDGDVMAVSDLRADPRYAQQPAVLGAPRARFCAVVALLTRTGRRLGLLSVLGPTPRQITDEQAERLQLLGRQTATVLLAPQLQQDLDRLKAAIRVVSNDHARLTLRSIDDGVVTIDAAGRITFLNTLAEHITGWTMADALGKRLSQVVTLKDEDGQSYVVPELEPSGFSANPITARTLLVRRDGHEISIEGTFAPIIADDRSLAGTVFAFRNVTLARKVAAELNHQATHDPLTGLANRRALERRIGHALKTAAENGSRHALLYLDLDQFKVVNDSAGHIAGDELLRQLSGLLKQHLRETDLLARLGGDEFGVLLENCDPGHAELVAEKLRQTVEQFSFVWKGRAFDIGVSIGLIDIRDHSMTLIDILSYADEACYAAKALGRNQVHVYEPGEHAQAQHHTELEWMEEIKAALSEGRMFLCSQPIIAIDPSVPCGHVEVLLRMRARSGAIVPPMAFIPAAERYLLMPALDRWVIGSVLRHLVALPEDRNLHAINLSAASVLDESFPKFVRDAFTELDVAPERVCFEISETVAIAHLGHAVALIDELRGFGCCFAIDDFGSGMSSFGYLKQLRVDYLKIDGPLVQGVVDDPVHYAMVDSINRIGQLMGIRTIAEFVEDDAILEAVRAMGVDCVQGYGLARPHSLDRPHVVG